MECRLLGHNQLLLEFLIQELELLRLHQLGIL
jgi:hypothetical protein